MCQLEQFVTWDPNRTRLMGFKLQSHGSKDVLLTLLRRASRTSSVIGFAAGYFLKVSYIILNTDYCYGRLNLLVKHFHMAKFSKSSTADVPFISKPKTQNDFLAS